MRKPKALVIGVSASEGLGAALCRKFAREGHHVVVAGRTETRLANVVEEIESNGDSATVCAMDTTVEADVIRAFDVAMADKGGLLKPDNIAEVYWHLHCQHPSTWTFELDVRPSVESF